MAVKSPLPTVRIRRVGDCTQPRPLLPLPPWSGDDEDMYQWCIAQIEAQQKEERANYSGPYMDPKEGRKLIAIEYARYGDMWLLHQVYPELVEFLHPPKLPSGKHVRHAPQFLTHKAQVLDTVKRVKALWRKHYGKKQRKRDDGIKATEIAALYHHQKLKRVEL